MSNHRVCDVVIVGAGPVGVTSALLLNQLGHKVQVIERHSSIYQKPRAVVLYHQGIRLFAGHGVMDKSLEGGRAGAAYDLCGILSPMALFENHDGEFVATLEICSKISKFATSYFYWIHQPSLEKVLEKACNDRGVIIRRSTELIDIEELEWQVKLSLQAVGPDLPLIGETQTTEARFVIGCDGANSKVRNIAGIGFHEHAPRMSRWLVLDLIPTMPVEDLKWQDLDVCKQYFDYARPRTSVPSPAHRRRWEFMILEEETDEEAIKDEFLWKLLADFNCGPDTVKIERKIIYSINGG